MTQLIRKIMLMVLTAFFIQSSFAQSDLLVLKKNGRKIESYFPGAHMSFSTDYRYYEGYVTAIRNDSVFLVQYNIQYYPVLDTLSRNYFGLPVKEITSFPKQSGNFLYGSGLALKSGGILLTTAGLASWVLAEKNTRYYARPELVIGAAGAAVIGHVMTRIGRKPIVLGKKYTLSYISIH